jgi:glycosyltransferase involved in cell wall biosynthesis
MAPLTDLVICVAERVAKSIISAGIPKDKVRVIPNGVDLCNYDIPHPRRLRARRRIQSVLELPDDVTFIGFVGRLSAEKGLPTLLDAFRTICAQQAGVCLLIVGDGPMRGELEQYVTLHGLQRRVFFLGTRKRPQLWISVVDVLALPSYSEGMPMVLLEALAANVPIVASDIGGTGEIIQDGITGSLVPPRDASRLKDALCSLIENREKREIYGRNGLAVVKERYSIEQVAKLHEETYLTLLNRS